MHKPSFDPLQKRDRKGRWTKNPFGGFALDVGDVPSSVKEVAGAFNSRGFNFHLVGGYVRDRVRGGDPKDYDATTEARPEQIKEILNAAGAKSIYTIGEKFGTIGADMGDGVDVEVTTYRSEKYAPGSRHPTVEFGNSLVDDLARRDFTFNAMAYDPVTGVVVDPFNGARDLNAGVVRAVGNSEERIKEDPLRMLRATRFATRYGYDLDPELNEAMRANAGSIHSISNERIRDELVKMIGPSNKEKPSYAFEQLGNSGLLPEILPEVHAMKGVTQPGPHHDSDVYGHTMKVLDAVPDGAPMSTRLAALYHDTGKPETRVLNEDGSRATFFGHEDLSATKTVDALTRLRFDKDTVDTAAHLAREHMKPMSLYNAADNYTDSAVRRLIKRANLSRGDNELANIDDLMALNLADIKGHDSKHIREMVAEHQRLLDRIFKVKDSGPDPSKAISPLDGRELQELFNMRPGKWVGEVKALLTDMVIDGVLGPGDKEKARRVAAEYMKGQPND